MSDKEKFKALKEKMIHENEEKYGAETREKYGNDSVDASNKKMMNLSQDQWNRWKELEVEILERLEAGVKNGVESNSDEAKEIVMLHKEWLSVSIPNYTAQMHKGIAAMYVADEQFTKYYDRNVQGCANFLYEAVDYESNTKD